MAVYDKNGNIIAGGGGESGSPISGKKIILIGDSNTQYNGAGWKTAIEEKYGCVFTPFGYAGATWETANGTSTTENTSAVGKVNQIIAPYVDSGIADNYDYILIMMGTNCGTVGEVTDTSANVSTMCGAIRYCLEKLLYYYRAKTIGVILPPQRAEGNSGQLTRNNLIKALCDEYSVPTYDFYHQGQVVPDAKTPDGTNYYLFDGLHFGGNGGNLFINKIGKWVAYVL